MKRPAAIISRHCPFQMSDSESDAEEQESLEDAYNRAKVGANTAEERWTPVEEKCSAIQQVKGGQRITIGKDGPQLNRVKVGPIQQSKGGPTPNTEEERWASLQQIKGGHQYSRASGLEEDKERSAKTEQWWSPYQRANLGIESTEQM
jgi:hypothetical protein